MRLSREKMIWETVYPGLMLNLCLDERGSAPRQEGEYPHDPGF